MGDPFLFADDFKLLAHGKLETEIQSDLEQGARWVEKNKMGPNKCSQLVIKGRIPRAAEDLLESLNSATDLGVVANTPLTWCEVSIWKID